MDAVNYIIVEINHGFDYVKSNAMQIGFIVFVIYFIKTKLMTNTGGLALNSTNRGSFLTRGTSSSNNNKSREEDMRRVRLQQQELLTKRAIEAEKERREVENEKKLKKLQLDKDKAGKNTVGDGGTNSKKKKKNSISSNGQSNGYNPMQPWSSSSGGYRAPRRKVNRG